MTDSKGELFEVLPLPTELKLQHEINFSLI